VSQWFFSFPARELTRQRVPRDPQAPGGCYCCISIFCWCAREFQTLRFRLCVVSNPFCERILVTSSGHEWTVWIWAVCPKAHLLNISTKVDLWDEALSKNSCCFSLPLVPLDFKKETCLYHFAGIMHTYCVEHWKYILGKSWQSVASLHFIDRSDFDFRACKICLRLMLTLMTGLVRHNGVCLWTSRMLGSSWIAGARLFVTLTRRRRETHAFYQACSVLAAFADVKPLIIHSTILLGSEIGSNLFFLKWST